jgi:6-phosphogluconolactonase (cycloisomerase 2 family)
MRNAARCGRSRSFRRHRPAAPATIDPAGVMLYAANQDSDTIVPMRIDPAKGALTPTGQTIKVANPVSIVFA